MYSTQRLNSMTVSTGIKLVAWEGFEPPVSSLSVILSSRTRSFRGCIPLAQFHASTCHKLVAVVGVEPTQWELPVPRS